MPQWPKNPVIYEINSWPWLQDLSHKYETPIHLGNVPYAEWDEIKKNGFDAVWLMGVWERSPEGVVISNLNEELKNEFVEALPDFSTEDNIGSAYCVKGYTVDPRLGGNEALTTARADMAERGLMLILDYIPNHVARDHAWLESHPEYFIHGNVQDLFKSNGDCFEKNQQIFACGKDPYFPAWQDTAQLNVFRPDVRRATVLTIQNIASICDGIRVDMAMLLLNQVFEGTWGEKAGPRPAEEFWQEVIDAIHFDHPNFLFLAEAYWDLEWQLIQCGFDYCYDKRMYDRLVNGNANEIQAHLSADLAYQERMARFIENHDEKRASATFPLRKQMLATMAISTTPGLKIFHEGQMEGRKVHLPVFLKRRPEEAIYTDHYRFHQQIIRTASSPLVRNGNWQLCQITGWENLDSHKNLVAWSIHREMNMLLAVLNYSEIRSQGSVHLNNPNLLGSSWRLVDLLKGDVYVRNGAEMTQTGLYVDLPAWDFHFLWFNKNAD
jgi:hypothetical protein